MLQQRSPLTRRRFLSAASIAGLGALAYSGAKGLTSVSAARGGPASLPAQHAAPSATRAPYNGQAWTPSWGFNTYYAYDLDGFNEDTLMAGAQAMVKRGLQQAGYTMFGIDDGWAAMDRDADGNLVADARRFPSGLGALVDKLHALGFAAGIYGDMGERTCGGRPGSYRYEEQDAHWFAAQGFDYIKMDWCTAEKMNAQERYSIMSRAIAGTGRPITFSVCNWGRQDPWQWAPPIANSARTSSDIGGIFDGDNVTEKYNSYNWTCFLKNLDANQHPEVAGPGYANDPDCLQVGNGFFDDQVEETSQLHLWAVMASPMLLGLDVTTMSGATLEMLTHPALGSINRDPWAWQGVRIKSERGSEVWVKALSDGRSYAMVMFNRTDSPSTASINWKDVWNNVGSAYVRDLWNATEVGVKQDGLHAPLQAHQSLLLQVAPQT